MKRTVICICVFVISFFSLSFSVYAAGTTNYVLDELGLSVSLPSDYIVFTRDISADDPDLDAYGLTKDGMLSLMTTQNIYLNAWDKDINHEIVITMTDSYFSDFNLCSDTVLSTMATALTSGYETYGITYIKSEIYQHKQAKFLKIYISQPKGDITAYGLQYYTVYADKAINITMHSYSGKITPSNEVLLKSIVDSAAFDTDPLVAETPAVSTSAFIYTDSETQAKFTVPANWTEAALVEEREYIDVKFMSNEEEGMCIFYGSTDLWSEMPLAESVGLSRSDFDNTIFTKADIAEMYSIPINNVDMVTYGGIEYFKATVTTTGTAYGLNLTVTVTQIFLVDNGYMYYFQFSGTRDNEYYDDFEALLKSAEYKYHKDVYPSSNIVNHGAVKYENTDSWDEFNLGDIIFSLIITIIVYSLPIMIYRYAIKKEPVEPRKARKITIIYGITAFIVMLALIFALNGNVTTGGAILLWSYINYRMLTGGSKNYSGADHSNSQDTYYAQEHPGDLYQPCISADYHGDEFRYCNKCGNKLHPGSVFCSTCGAKLH